MRWSSAWPRVCSGAPGVGVVDPKRLRVYAIADASVTDARVRAWAAGGVTALQLRDKTAPDAAVLERALALAALCRELGLLFIINDRAEWQAPAGADGVHVGQADRPDEARRLLGPGALLGVSVADPEQARRAAAAGADYLGAGPVFPTGSKADAAPAIGLAGLAALCAAAPRIPVVAIGGITADNAADTIAAGAAGVAVISALAGSEPQADAARLVQAVGDKKGQKR